MSPRTRRGRALSYRLLRPLLERLEERCLLAQLLFSVQPRTTDTGNVLDPVEVSIQGGGTGTITLALGDNPGGMHLGGTVTRAAVNGKATFNDLVLFGGTPARDYSLTAFSGGHTTAISQTFDVKSGATHLHIATNLKTTAAGANLGPITVQVLDENGTLARDVDGTQVTLVLDHNPGQARFRDAAGNVLASNPVATIQNGVAIFTDVRLDRAGVGYSLAAVNSSPIVQDGVSNLFAIIAGQAAGLAFVEAPVYGVANQPLNIGGRIAPFTAVGVTVQVTDRFGNAVLDATSSVSIARQDGGSLGGPLTATASGGLARFDALVVPAAVNNLVLVASVAGLTSAISRPFNVLATEPNRLNILNAPTTAVRLRERLVGTSTMVDGVATTALVVEVLDAGGNRLTGLSGIQVKLGPAGNLFGTTIVTVVNGLAVFDNVFMGGRNLDPAVPASLQVQLQAQFVDLPYSPGFSAQIPLAAGQPVKLVLANVGVIDNAVAGDYLTSNGAPIKVFVQDADGNTVTGNTTRVYLGVNRAAPNSDTTPLGNGPTPGDPATMGIYAEAVAVDGVATFDRLYINRASVKYQLAAGTKDLALNTNTSKEFTVSIGAADSVRFLVQPDTVGARQRMTGIGNQILVAVTDRVGNVVVADNSTVITMSLAANPGGATLSGRTQLTVSAGVAVFDLMYMELLNTSSISGNQLQATAAGLPNPTTTSSTFTLNPPPGGTSIPLPEFVVVTQPSQVGINQALSFSYRLRRPGQTDPDSTYDQLANVLVQLFTSDGKPASSKLVGAANQTTRQPVDGLVTFTGLSVSEPGRYQIRALLDLGAQEIFSIPFNVGTPAPSSSAASASPPPLGDVTPPPIDPHIVQLDLGSYTENFDYISSLDAYRLQPSGDAQPISQQFRPPSADASSGTQLPMVQPNITTPLGADPGFTQVPQSTKWWSSILFQRIEAVGIDARDSKGNRLFPMYADPYAMMVNDGNTFAGIGLTHLTHRFVIPASEYADNLDTQLDGRYPGNIEYYYGYSGVNIPDQRLYQDISVGLKGVQADATVRAYSDWTVTLDWGRQLQATLGQGLPIAYFTATNVGTGKTMQVVTSNPNRTTTVRAFNAAGQEVTSGTGAVRLQISYTVREKVFPRSEQLFDLEVTNSYGVFLPAGVAWTITNGNLEANLTGTKNYFSVATLPDNTQATFNFFRQRAYSFVTGSTTNFTFDEGSGKLTTTFSLQTRVMESGGDLINNRPLQALYLNQHHNLAPGTVLTSYTYESPRGTMRLFDGPSYATVLQHRGTLPLVPSVPDDGTSHANLWNNYLLPYLVSISSTSTFDGSLALDRLIPNGQNNYLDFQTVLGAVQLVPILLDVSTSNDAALSLADKALAEKAARTIFEQVKGRMGAWMSAMDDADLKMFYYQPESLNEAEARARGLGKGWQVFLSEKPGFLSSETLNDQNLIAGYFLKTAAILTQYDTYWGATRSVVDSGQTTFAGKLGEMVNRVVRNVSNYDRSTPPTDGGGVTGHPFLRNFDVLQGHSWADGAANDPLGTNQESSSEAINYASALIQWGEATGDVALRDLGVYLYNTEIESFNTYYFNVNQGALLPGETGAFPDDFRNNPNPPPAGDNRPSVAILFSASSGYRGFIGLIPSAMAGIQMLPFTGGSLYLGRDTEFAQRNLTQALTSTSEDGGVPIKPSTYLGVLYPYQAFIDPDLAMTNYTSQLASIGPINPGVPIDNPAFNVHWIQVFQAYGKVDASVIADTVSYAVFIKTPGNPATRTFIAYNASRLPRVVTFRDATGAVVCTMTVPARTMTTMTPGLGRTIQKTSADLSQQTPLGRFFFSATTAQNGNPTLLHAQTGTGEKAVIIPASGGTFQDQAPTDPTRKLTFEITGLTGTLKSGTAQAFYSLWLDPQFGLDSGQAAYVRVQITYYPDSTGANPVRHLYDGVSLSKNQGYVNGTSVEGGGVIGIPMVGVVPYPRQLTNGKVTIEIWCREGTRAVRLRTDAVGEQGRVSFLDLPYDFTSVGGISVNALVLPGRAVVPMSLPASSGSTGFTSPASGAGHTYSAVLSADGKTANWTGNASSDLLVFGQRDGFLTHNRFAAGDPGFASDQDFDSTRPGIQRLPAAVTSRVLIDTGTGRDTVQLGGGEVSASSLQARFTISDRDQGDQLIIQDGPRTVQASYTISAGRITTADGSLDVRLGARPLTRGIFFTTGQGVNTVLVLASRASEPVALNTASGLDVITLGNGSVQDIRGAISIRNSTSFSDLIVDNSPRVADFSTQVSISSGGILGLAPAPIQFVPREVDDVQIYGGTNSGVYRVTGSFPGSYLYLDAGFGNDRVLLGNASTLSDAAFPGLILLEGGPGADQLVADNGAGGARGVRPSSNGLLGLIREGIEFDNFDLVSVLLGPASDVVSVGQVRNDVTYVFRLGGGNDQAFVRNLTVPVTIRGEAGNDILSVDGAKPPYTYLTTLDGGPGNDRYLLSTPGATLILVDSSGVDTLDFRAATAGIRLNLSLAGGQAQSIGGAGMMVQLVGTFENVVGSAFADAITGNAAANLILGLGGNDVLSGNGGLDCLEGGEGNDRLIARTGNALLLGGLGNDVLEAGSGRSILIGGEGSDRLFAGLTGLAGSVLIGGGTTHEVNAAALRALLAEWASAHALNTRIRNLRNGTGGGRLNGNYFLDSTTLTNEGIADTLFGNSRFDWFLSFPGDVVINRG